MIRTGVDDAAIARVVGIRVSRLFTIVFSLGAVLPALPEIGGPILKHREQVGDPRLRAAVAPPLERFRFRRVGSGSLFWPLD